MEYADVQNWITVSNVVNNLQRIGFELRSVKLRYPDRRVRAVGKDGRLIDLLD
jgi:DNA integrity scanning protein DisA with diadenylate cyclase activity